MIRLAALGSAMGVPGLVVLSETTPLGWDQALIGYGVAAPFALLCLYQIRKLEAALDKSEARNQRLVDRLINVALPAQRRSADVSQEVLAMLRSSVEDIGT